MDYLDTPRVLRAIVRSIETVVIPTVDDEFARSQLWASTGVLGNIANDLENDRAPSAAIGSDLAALMAAAGVPDGFGDPDATADAAAGVSEEIDAVVAGHATLHYRRSVAGFDES